MSGLGKAVVFSLLCGCLNLVFGGEFKGNLAEPEFLASYVGHVAGFAALLTLIIFPASKFKLGRAATVTTQPPQRSRWFPAVVVVLSGIIIAKVAMDYPIGEGLFHPTHAANVAEANRICLSKFAGNTTAPDAATMTFCACWANEVALAGEKDRPEAPQIIAPRVNAKCAQVAQMNAR